MALTDPIASMFTSIRNANIRLHEKLDVPASKIKEETLKIMRDEGFISNYKFIEDDKQGILRIYLKYAAKQKRVITGIKRVSKPGLRAYCNWNDLPKVRGGLGVAIVSTSKGLMTSQEAKKKRV